MHVMERLIQFHSLYHSKFIMTEASADVCKLEQTMYSARVHTHPSTKPNVQTLPTVYFRTKPYLRGGFRVHNAQSPPQGAGSRGDNEECPQG